MLSLVYRASNLAVTGVAGLAAVDSPAVESYDVSSVVKAHNKYRHHAKDVLRLVRACMISWACPKLWLVGFTLPVERTALYYTRVTRVHSVRTLSLLTAPLNEGTPRRHRRGAGGNRAADTRGQGRGRTGK